MSLKDSIKVWDAYVEGTLTVAGKILASASALLNNIFLTGRTAAGVDRRLIGVTSGDVVSIDADALGSQFGGAVGIGTTPVTGNSITAAEIIQGLVGTTRTVCTGNATLTSASRRYQFFDAGASNRDCTLDATCEAGGVGFVIWNFGVANNIVVKNAGGDTLATLTPSSGTTVVYDGTAWQVM